MVSNPKPISVMPETDWPKLLDEAVKGPVLLEHDGVVLRLVRAEKEEEDITAGYDPDPEAVRAMLGDRGRQLGAPGHRPDDRGPVRGAARRQPAARPALMYLLDTDWIIQVLAGHQLAVATSIGWPAAESTSVS